MEKERNNTNIELRSEEVQELMGKIPPIILRVGISFIFVCIMSVFILSHYIKYPDIITLEAILRNTDYATDIKNKRDGFILTGTKECIRQVAKGDTLVVITQMQDEGYEEAIISPITGIVYPCNYFHESEYICASTRIYTIANTIYSKVTAKTFVTRTVKEKLRIGMKTEAVVNGFKISGKVTYIAKIANIQDETFTVLIELYNPSGPLNEIIWNYHTSVKILLDEQSVFDKFFLKNLIK